MRARFAAESSGRGVRNRAANAGSPDGAARRAAARAAAPAEAVRAHSPGRGGSRPRRAAPRSPRPRRPRRRRAYRGGGRAGSSCCTMAESAAVDAIAATNERSILISPTGRLLRWPSDEKPVPKSSSERPTPSWSRRTRTSWMRTGIGEDRALGDLDDERRRRQAVALEVRRRPARAGRRRAGRRPRSSRTRGGRSRLRARPRTGQAPGPTPCA